MAKRLLKARYRQPNSPLACHERAASLHRVHVLLVSCSRCEAQHCRIHQHTNPAASELSLTLLALAQNLLASSVSLLPSAVFV